MKRFECYIVRSFNFEGILLDVFAPLIQFYVLLNHYLCFTSFIYLDLYVFGDDALTSFGSFMQTKHLCALSHILTKGDDGAAKPV